MIDATEFYGLEALDDPFRGDYERARSLLDGSEWAVGLTELEQLARKGSMLSTICVAGCMLEGWGYDQDLVEAEAWYRIAAEAGFSAGIFGLGLVHTRMGEFAKAATELQRAVCQDYRPAHNALAYLYASGKGVPLDRQKALALWRVGASQGHMPARRGLARALIRGYGGFGGRFEGLGLLGRLVSEILSGSPSPPSRPKHPIRPPSTVH